MRLIDYALVAVIAALVIWAIWYMRRHKAACGGCASCPYADSCKKRGELRKNKKK